MSFKGFRRLLRVLEVILKVFKGNPSGQGGCEAPPAHLQVRAQHGNPLMPRGTRPPAPVQRIGGVEEEPAVHPEPAGHPRGLG